MVGRWANGTRSGRILPAAAGATRDRWGRRPICSGPSRISLGRSSRSPVARETASSAMKASRNASARSARPIASASGPASLASSDQPISCASPSTTRVGNASSTTGSTPCSSSGSGPLPSPSDTRTWPAWTTRTRRIASCSVCRARAVFRLVSGVFSSSTRTESSASHSRPGAIRCGAASEGANVAPSIVTPSDFGSMRRSVAPVAFASASIAPSAAVGGMCSTRSAAGAEVDWFCPRPRRCAGWS